MRRLLLLLASPLLLAAAFFSLLVGFAFYADSNPATFVVLTAAPATVQGQRVLYLLARAFFFPFQLGFIVLAFGAALWVFRRRLRIGGWVLGEPVAGRLRREGTDEARPTVLRPERRLTLQQIIGSILAVLALGLATVLAIGQFVPRADLAVVIAALTSGLTWGARLPIGDVLGGISNIFETNVSVGERIVYRQFSERVEGQVEDVDLRFLNVRADSGELTSIPHGELRVFRNFSRSDTSGVYATFPVHAQDLNRAVALLSVLADESPTLATQLVEPWHVMSLDGRLGGVTGVTLFGRTTPGNEDDLQLALHALVQVRFAAEGIPLAGKKGGRRMSRRLLLVIFVPLLAIVALTALTVGLLQTAQVDELELVESVIGSGPLPAWLVTLYGYAELPLRLAFVVVIFGLAWLVTRISGRLAGWALRMGRYEAPPVAQFTGIAPPTVSQSAILENRATPSAQARRYQTVQLLLASFINFIAFIVAFILAAGQFVSLVNLAVVSTIVANAFGFAARDYIGDFLNGISNIFENRFDVGDNVSIFRVGDTLEGTVERVTVRTLTIRTRAGELIVVPQGEVRILRNYSRGSFTGTHVVVMVAAADLPQALAVLLALAEEAVTLLPDLLEPWKVVGQDGELGAAAEIHLHARARYGRGAELRLRIMTLVAERLAAAGVALAD